MASEPTSSPPVIPPATAAVARTRILYIDDDEAISRLVQKDLTRHGFDVTLRHDGKSGVAAAEAGTYDIIALDHYMPGQDGLATLEDLARLPQLPPVIYVTGTDEGRVAVAALKQGAADYVIKETSGSFLELLRSAIAQALSKAALVRAKAAADAEIRAARDSFEKLAANQALLLKEVNHRVANSLQLISSLIQLQARSAVDAEARECLMQARGRVHAVMQIHRRLYTSEDVEFVEMDLYLRGLIEELSHSMVKDHQRIELDAQPIKVHTDKAVSVGVIVNELVTNALKYAYPEGDGPIRVAFRQRAADTLSLVIEDDGVGYPLDDAAAPMGSGIGAVVVRAMAGNLHSLVELDRQHRGTRFTITFAA